MAYNCYLEVEASGAGAITGNVSSVSIAGVDTSSWVECSEFTTHVSRSGEGTSGDTHGTFQCGTLDLLTKWGPDTPMFLQVIAANELLTGTIHFFDRNQTQTGTAEAGALEEKMTAAFVGGRLTNLTMVSPNTLHAETSNLAPWVQLSISYNSMTVTHPPDGKEAIIDWTTMT